MQYGAMNFPILSIVSEIETFAKMGFDYLELTMDAPMAHYEIIKQEKDNILKALKTHQMGLICHLPTFVYLADLTTSIREASIQETLFSIDAAAQLKVSKAVLHPAIISGMGRFAKDIAMQHAFNSLKIIVNHAHDKGICLCLENMPPKFGAFFEPDEFTDLFCQFPLLKFTLDVGHANIDAKKTNKYLEFIDKLGKKIGHLHISDNNGKKDEHLPMGQGTINFKKIIQALKKYDYQDTVTFEIFTKDRNYLFYTKEQFKNLWELN